MAGQVVSAVTAPLVLHGLVKSYRDFTLGPVSAAVGPGVTALLGANGAGKSTLLRLLVGVLPPERGQITWSAASTAGHVGYLPQDFRVPRNVRVDDYLRFVAWCRSSRGNRLGDEDVAEALRAVGLEDRARDRLGSLSGGMVRRVGVAQALIGRPSVLVLDEPTVGLDPVQRRELRSLMARIGETAKVIVSTHLSEDVAAVASSVLVLDHGRLAFDGGVDSLVRRAGGIDVTGDGVEQGFLTVVSEGVHGD